MNGELKFANEMEKRKWFETHYPFAGELPAFSGRRSCLCCDQWITVGDFHAVDEGFGAGNLICCPNWPKCNGSAIDWMFESYSGPDPMAEAKPAVHCHGCGASPDQQHAPDCPTR